MVTPSQSNPHGAVRWLVALLLAGLAVGLSASPAVAHIGAAIAVDGQGRIYFVDTTRDRLWRIERSGRLTLLAEQVHTNVIAVTRSGTVRYPDDTVFVVAGPDRSLYRVHGHRIMRLHPEQWLTVLAGDTVPGFRDGTGREARFDRILGLAADSGGNVYVADYGNRRVRRVTPRGEVSTVYAAPWPWLPTGVAVWEDRVYVLERWGDYEFGPAQVASAVTVFADIVGHPRVKVIFPDGRDYVFAAVVGWGSRLLVIVALGALVWAVARRSRCRGWRAVRGAQ